MILAVTGFSIFLYLVQIIPVISIWLPKEAAIWAIEKFEQLEAERSKNIQRGTDRRSSAPFISGDGFRLNSSHVCEDANRLNSEYYLRGHNLIKSYFYYTNQDVAWILPRL